MRIDEFIQKLLEISHEHGNLEIYVNTTDWDSEPTKYFDIKVNNKVEFDPDYPRCHARYIDDMVELVGDESELDMKHVLLD